MKKQALEIYIHIPFCVKKCLYCDFLSGPAKEPVQERYVKALMQEITEKAGAFADYEVQSVFVGGGTPSILRKELLTGIMQTVREKYSLAVNAEITVEVNPGTVDFDKLKAYHDCGVNRLSIGLQSANDTELRTIGRIHTYAQFLDTYNAAVAAGFTNINIDLMSTLPGQSLDSYRETLTKVTNLQPAPTHISAYSLILEEGTALYDMVESGQVDYPDEELDRELYAETKEILNAAGYHRYEISNYARDGFACRHNCGYWTGTEYVGFGIGAASYVGKVRYKNGENLQAYLANPCGVIEEEHALPLEEQMEEFMFLGLRMTAGVSIAEFEERFGKKLTEVYGEVIDKNIQEGLLEKAEGRVYLTAKGLDLSNYVMAQFLLD